MRTVKLNRYAVEEHGGSIVKVTRMAMKIKQQSGISFVEGGICWKALN